MGLGFTMMVLGMLGYVGSMLYSLMIEIGDIDEARLVTLVSFLSMISFMLGCILEVKDLHHPNPIEVEDSPTPKIEYLDEYKKRTIGIMMLVIAILLLLCLVLFAFLGSAS